MADPVTTGALVASALSVGGATFVKGFITEGAKDLYGQLRGRLVRLSAPAVESLEAKPESVNRQGVIAEIVDERDEGEKRELAMLARALIDALREQGKTAMQTNITVIATNGGNAAGRDQTINNYGIAAPTARRDG
jgi:hypothetical protein